MAIIVIPIDLISLNFQSQNACGHIIIVYTIRWYDSMVRLYGWFCFTCRMCLELLNDVIFIKCLFYFCCCRNDDQHTHTHKHGYTYKAFIKMSETHIVREKKKRKMNVKIRKYSCRSNLYLATNVNHHHHHHHLMMSY